MVFYSAAILVYLRLNWRIYMIEMNADTFIFVPEFLQKKGNIHKKMLR